MKYRIMERDGLYRIQQRIFGFLWKWARLKSNGMIFQTQYLAVAEATIRADESRRKKGRGGKWRTVPRLTVVEGERKEPG